MKKLLSVLFIFLLASCQRNRPQTSSAQQTSTGTESSKLCFQRLEGTSRQDTATITLIIKNKEVTGSFNHMPHEKDSRLGKLKGQKDGDIIKAVWSFMQEGISDTLSVEFKLSANKLYQKSFGIDETTGRQKLTKDSKFTIEYQPVNCKE